MKSMKQEQKLKLQTYAFTLLASILITLIILPLNIVNVPRLKPGEVSPSDIRSPYSIKVKDVEKTETLREEAKKKVPPLFKLEVSNEKDSIKAIENLDNLTDKEKNRLKNILKSLFSRGIVKEVPQGYEKIEVLLPEGKREEVKVKELIEEKNLKTRLQKELSKVIGKEKAGKVAEEIVGKIKPNLIYLKKESEIRWEKAEKKVKPAFINLKKGELVVRKGERVTPEVVKKLELIREEKSKGRGTHKYLSIFLLSLITIYLVIRLYKILSPSTFNLKNLLFSFSVITLDILLIRIFTYLSKLIIENFNVPLNESLVYVPVVTSTIFASMFINKKVAVLHLFPVSIISSFLISKPELLIIPTTVGGVFSCFDSRKYRSREVIYKSAFTMGTVILLIQELILTYYHGLKTTPENFAFPILSLVGSLISSVVVNGVSPILINIFKFTTDMVYMELINLNHPLLRKLVLKAPGTYSHSIMVATLAEAAAETIGANSLLAKAGGLFHDIGKLKNPQAFIENQLNGINIHDKLPPEKSAAILRSHVEYGEELGRKYGLPEKVIEIIKQHHGTKLMKYFYHKAKELYGDKVDEKKFRYPGPKPQFKEAGIVLLADTVEAAIRSMKDKEFNLEKEIHRLIMEEIEDGQLTQSGLSLKDISLIEKVFKKVLSGIYHSRIEYPEENGGQNGGNR